MNSLVLSSKSNTLFASGTDGRIFSGDFTNLKAVATGIQNPYPNKVIALSKDENYLVNGTDSSFVQIYNLKAPNQKPTVIAGFKGATNDIEFLPVGSGFIVSSGDKLGASYQVNEVNQTNGSK
jgi:WD40 repeat protein